MRIEILNNDEMRRIHEASLAILEDTGIQIDHKKTLEMLADAGANVVDILKQHEVPPLEDAVIRELEKIVKAAENETRLPFTERQPCF